MAWTVEDHLRDKPEHVRQLFEAFERLIATCGPYQTVVAKSAISFKGTTRGFAGATPRMNSVSGFLDLMEELEEPPFTRVVPYTNKLWVHRFKLTDLEQLDDRFALRVREAYRVGQGAHRR